jgi:hypothetical protein
MKYIQAIFDDPIHKKTSAGNRIPYGFLFPAINIINKKCIEILSIKQFLFSSHNYQILIKVDISFCKYTPSITSSNQKRTSYAGIPCSYEDLAHQGTNDGGALRLDLLVVLVRTGAGQSRICGSFIMSTN